MAGGAGAFGLAYARGAVPRGELGRLLWGAALAAVPGIVVLGGYALLHRETLHVQFPSWGLAAVVGGFSFAEYVPIFFAVEEVLFRGVLDSYVARQSDGPMARAVTAVVLSALWGLWHLPLVLKASMGASAIASMVGLMLLVHVVAGVALTAAWRWKGTLLVPAVAHALVDGAGRFLDKSSRFLTNEKALELGCTFLEPGDVLVSRMADPIGRACVFPGVKQPCVTVVDVCIIRPGAGRVDNRWLTAAINSPQFRGKIELAASGTTRSRVSRSNLGSLELPLPSLPEQRRIVEKLEVVQARSGRARAAINAVPPLLEKLRQSILAAAFRGDLTKDWRAKHKDVEPASELLKRIRVERRKKWEEGELAKMAAKGKMPRDEGWRAKYKAATPIDANKLPRLPDDWCWVSLDELLLQIDAGRSPKAHGRPATGQEPGVLKVSAVSWDEFDATENKALLDGEEIGDTPTVRAGDLLISRANTVQLVGAVVVAKADHPNLMLSDKTLRLVPASSSVLPELLLQALRTQHVRELFEDATGTSDSMRNLSQQKILAAPIPLSPQLEGEMIARVLADAVNAIRAVSKRREYLVEKAQDFERAILARAFRGELVGSDDSRGLPDVPSSGAESSLRDGPSALS